MCVAMQKKCEKLLFNVKLILSESFKKFSESVLTK